MKKVTVGGKPADWEPKGWSHLSSEMLNVEIKLNCTQCTWAVLPVAKELAVYFFRLRLLWRDLPLILLRILPLPDFLPDLRLPILS